jgi:hypothetical protein
MERFKWTQKIANRLNSVNQKLSKIKHFPDLYLRDLFT